MKIFKRILTALLCAIISLSFFTVAYAATTPQISITTSEAKPGDTVRINISISNNPGIMAMAFCITYDSETLEYKNYAKGYLSNYTVQDHADKGHISFVNVENKNVSTNGVLLGLVFEVKKDATPGNHVISLANSNREKHGTKLHNSFSNSKQEFIIPKVVSGSVVVPETCENSGHKYGDWNILKDASCTETGLKKHFCVRCETSEEITIPITHDFENDWTIDKEATPQEDGVMSRHCTKCDEITDKVTFKYEEIGDSDDTSSESSSDTVSDASSEKIDSSIIDSSNASSDTTKPIINNTVGEKVPLQEVEKLEDYQQNVKPNIDNNTTQSETESNVPDLNSSTDTTTTGPIQNSEPEQNKQKPTLDISSSEIVLIILCSILSIGIIALGVILILRNKKSQ